MEQDFNVPWSDLVIAMLAVNRCSLEKVYALGGALHNSGLFDPENLSRWNTEVIGRRLEQSGYRRGEYLTQEMASRLKSLGDAVYEIGRASCEAVLRSHDLIALRATLGRVRGIGPVVLQNYVMLSTSVAEQVPPTVPKAQP